MTQVKSLQTILVLALMLSLIAPFSVLADPSDPWYNASWGYRVAITIDDAQVDADLTNYPVYVNLANLPAGFHTNVKSDGSDIRVTSGDGTTELAREVVIYDAATDTGELHFKAPTVANASDTEFYIYYGNAAASEYGRGDTYGLENVWETNYRAVYHLQEDGNTTSGGYIDSTANDRHATGVALTNASDVAGKLGTSQDFNGTSQYISLVSGTLTLAAGTTPLSMQAWINADSTGDKSEPIITSRSSTDADPILGLMLGSDGVDNFETGFAAYIVRDNSAVGLQHAHDNTDLNNDTWNMLHFTRTTGKVKTLYVNGVSEASGTDTMANPLTSTIGAIGGERRWIQDNQAPTFPNRKWFDGEIDEVRIYSGALTAAWVDAEYSNHNTPTTFYAVGNEEAPAQPAPAARLILNLGKFLLVGGQLLMY
ncbi:MAG: DUF2341 domain-containing protein [Patescibacteria group bacterium]